MSIGAFSISLTVKDIKVSKGENVFLALAPVSVIPEMQGKGIGGKLIIKGHEIAKKLGVWFCSRTWTSDLLSSFWICSC